MNSIQKAVLLQMEHRLQIELQPIEIYLAWHQKSQPIKIHLN